MWKRGVKRARPALEDYNQECSRHLATSLGGHVTTFESALERERRNRGR